MGNDIVEVQAPAIMINQAIEKGANLEQLEKLLELQERHDRNEARKAYHVAMAEFKKHAPKILKDARVSYGTTAYSHATLSNIVETITPLLSEHGLSVSWGNKQNGQVTVVCKITHVKGHSEETELTAGADTSGSKNSIQAIGSTISYLQRYSLLAILGLATHDQDNDARTVDEGITDKELHGLRDRIIALNGSEEQLCNVLGIEGLDNITKPDYVKALSLIEAKEKEAK